MEIVKFYKKLNGEPFYAGFDENGKNLIDICNFEQNKMITKYINLDIKSYENNHGFIECSKQEFMTAYNEVLNYFNLQQKNG